MVSIKTAISSSSVILGTLFPLRPHAVCTINVSINIPSGYISEMVQYNIIQYNTLCPHGRMWATEPDAELPVKMGKEGIGAKAATTVFEVFQKTVEDHGDRPALKFKDTSQVPRFLMLCTGTKNTQLYYILRYQQNQ